MGFSVLLLGALHAAEPSAIWTPGVEQVGQQGLVSGEFDGHAGLDWAASYRSGDSFGLVLQLSGSDQDWFLTTEEDLSGMRLKAGNWDGDSEDEILLGLPHYGAGGAAGVLDLSEAQEAPLSLEEAVAYWVEDAEDGAQSGTDVTLVDCVEGGRAELIVSAPQSRMNGTVYAFSSESGPTALGNWTVKWESSHRFGFALQSVENEGLPSELLVASCDYDPDLEESCASDGQIWQLSAEACNTSVSLDASGAELGGLSPTPMRLGKLTEESAGASAILWSAPESKTVVGLDPVEVLFAHETPGDAGDFFQTQEAGETQSWLASSGSVWKIPGFLGDIGVEDSAHRNFELDEGESLGIRFAGAGDWDADGCPDVLASSESGESLWLLSACEKEPEDTGQPSDSGLGPDTGTPSDTGEVSTDTGELGDTGEEPCASEFGWRCSASPPVWRPGFWGLLLGAFCLNRRRKTD